MESNEVDQYTSEVKQWLNERFRATTSDGYFYAHQNIYGFKSPYAEPGIALRYVIMYNVLKALSHLRFDTLLDVGCAEGYMTAVIRQFFNAQVQGTDLSEEACARAREIFQVPADPVDAVQLPYANEAFDVVLSSETLEHIPNYDEAFRELLRVARRAVVITVPQDPPQLVADNIRRQIPHAHVHAFTLDSFRDLIPSVYAVQAWGLYSGILRLPYRLVEGRPISLEFRGQYEQLLLKALNPVITFADKVMNEGALKMLLKLDDWLAKRFPTQRQLIFVILKDPTGWIEPAAAVDVDELLAFQVPLHPLSDPSQAIAPKA